MADSPRRRPRGILKSASASPAGKPARRARLGGTKRVRTIPNCLNTGELEWGLAADREEMLTPPSTRSMELPPGGEQVTDLGDGWVLTNDQRIRITGGERSGLTTSEVADARGNLIKTATGSWYRLGKPDERAMAVFSRIWAGKEKFNPADPLGSSDVRAALRYAARVAYGPARGIAAGVVAKIVELEAALGASGTIGPEMAKLKAAVEESFGRLGLDAFGKLDDPVVGLEEVHMEEAETAADADVADPSFAQSRQQSSRKRAKAK